MGRNDAGRGRRRVPNRTDFTRITEADALRVQRWVSEYPRGILDGRCAGRVLLDFAKEAGIEGGTAFVNNTQKSSLDFSVFNT